MTKPDDTIKLPVVDFDTTDVARALLYHTVGIIDDNLGASYAMKNPALVGAMFAAMMASETKAAELSVALQIEKLRLQAEQLLGVTLATKGAGSVQ